MNRLAATAAALCILLAACNPTPDAGTHHVVYSTSSGGFVTHDDALALASAERQARGLSPLRYDSRLAVAARDQAGYMAAARHMTHVGRGGSGLRDRADMAGLPSCFLSENVAAGQPTANAVVSAWMDSPGHRANILDRDMTSAAIISAEADGRRYWAMVMGGSC